MSQSIPLPLTILLVEKTGELKTLNVKDYKEDELFKKCGFKKADGFSKHNEWNIKINDQKYFVTMYGKDEGKANMENKYDFPPPIDSKLFFGCCVLVCQIRDNTGKKVFTNLTVDLWSKLYDKLFGGFEDLTTTNNDNNDNNDNNENDNDNDNNEEDELDNVPKSKKTKNGGYLKDGFVVDDESNENSESNDEYNSSEDSEESDDDNIIKIKNINKKNKQISNDVDELLLLEDVGSELSEDSYDYN
jgi:hypothetical protein